MAIADRSLRDLARSSGWLGLACLAAAAWLAWPRPRGATEDAPALRAIVIDASASVRRRAPGYASHLTAIAAREAREAAARGEEVALALYDRGARWWIPPGEAEVVLEGLALGRYALGPSEESPAADLAAALDLARAAVTRADRALGSVRVVGDGTAAGRDAQPVLDRLASEGIELAFEALPAPTIPDARVHAVRLPRTTETGAPLAALVEWSLDSGADGAAAWSADATVSLELEVRDATGERVIERALDWPSTADVRRTLIDLGPGREGAVATTARILLRGPGPLRSGDPLPLNDVARDATRVGPGRVALAVAPREDLANLRAWLGEATPGLDWIVTSPEDLATAPQDVDLVATFDLALDALPAARLDAVLARGGGWFHAAGWSWLSEARSATAERLAARLPLGPARLDGPGLERLFLVDGSGSMRGEPWEQVQRAVEGCLPLVPDRDRVVLQLFSNVVGRRVVLADAGERAGAVASERLRGVRLQGGSTQILACLAVVARTNLAPPVQHGTVLLLSDGREPDALNVFERAARIRADLHARGRSLAAFAAGPEADLGFLSELVGPSGPPKRAADYADLAELFREEVAAERLLDGEAARAFPVALEAPAQARELVESFGGALDVERAVRCALRGDATALLANEAGAPLLALGRAGGGTTAALATSHAREWGGSLAAADLAPVWRALARGADAGRTPRAARDGATVVLHGVGADAPHRFTATVRRERSGSRVLDAATEELLGELEFTTRLPPSGRDLSTQRVATARGALRESLAREDVVLRCDDPPLVVPLVAGSATEALPGARRAYHPPRVASAATNPRRGASGPHPAMPWVLAVGLLGVFSGALARLSQPRDEDQEAA